MGKFFKFGCLGLIGIIVLFVVIAMFAGGGEEDSVSTGSDGGQKETSKQEKKDDGTKKIDASSQTTDALGLKVGLGEIKISDNKLEVGINLENTTGKPLSFYPDQGSAVIGDMQLDANMFLTDGQVGGDVQGGVKQEGVLEFLAPEGKNIDVKSVKEIKLLFGDVITDDFMNTKPVEFTVPVQ